jgi:preprotein translocase subunit YajC
MDLKYSTNRNDVEPGDYVEIQGGFSHEVMSLNNDYVCIRTIKGDVWILKTNIVAVNPHLKKDIEVNLQEEIKWLKKGSPELLEFLKKSW